MKTSPAPTSLASAELSLATDIDTVANRLRGNAILVCRENGLTTQGLLQRACTTYMDVWASRKLCSRLRTRKYRDAVTVVSHDFIDQTALTGLCGYIVERLHAFAESGISTLNLIFPILTKASNSESQPCARSPKL